jgi:hypothetical protein
MHGLVRKVLEFIWKAVNTLLIFWGFGHPCGGRRNFGKR